MTQPGNSSSGSSGDLDVTLLRETAGRLSAAAPLYELLDEVVRFVTTVVKCDSCLIYLLEGNELVLRAFKNPHPEAVDRLALTGWVTHNREPVVIDERAYEDFRFTAFNELREDRFEAFLSIPVVSRGRLIGVINIQNRQPHRHTEREIIMIMTICSLVGADIERSRLEVENSILVNKLETRGAVDQAKVILQRGLKINEEAAYRTMQRESQQRRKSMKEIAEAIILSEELKQPRGRASCPQH